MSYTLSPYSYLQIAQALPRPSAAQRERFLQHVAGARRWPILLPADDGVPFTLFPNPQAGHAPVRAGELTGDHRGSHAATQYREAFGYLDYASPVARGVSVLTGADLGLPEQDRHYVLDDEHRAVALPPELLAAATCSLNATVHPDVVALIESLPLRVPSPALAGEPGDPLAPIRADAELRAFAENYVREELAGFQCPDDREAWQERQLEAFRQLYTPRNAEQRARLSRALDEMLTWIYHT